jgi:hypothetical protein
VPAWHSSDSTARADALSKGLDHYGQHVLIWVVDKKVVRHLVQQDRQLAEVPVRVSFEYALEEGTVLDGSLSLKTLYNKEAVCRHFPEIDEQTLEEEVQATVERAIDEHLAMSGFARE